MPVHITANQALAAANDDPKNSNAAREAREFLCEELADGPQSANLMIDKAKTLGISERTLARARQYLGVVASKDGFKDGWSWSLPAKGAKSAEGCQP